MDEQPANAPIQGDANPLPTLHRIAAIGDIHCEDDRLETALRHFASLNLDATLAVGDIVDGEGDVNRACKMLAESGVLAVRGNHDRWFLEGASEIYLTQLRYLRSTRPPVGGWKTCRKLDLSRPQKDLFCCATGWERMT